MRWADLVRSEHHLLENFAKEATQCPSDVFRTAPKNPQRPALKIKQQTMLRQQLTSSLNQLVGELLSIFPCSYDFGSFFILRGGFVCIL